MTTKADLQETKINQIYDQLNMIEVANRPKLPEYIFKSLFLPLFADLPNKNSSGTIANWIGIAGTPFNAVDVLETDGSVAFTVPPMLSREAIKPASVNRIEPISHIVAIAEKIALRSNRESSNYIDNKLSRISDELKNDVNPIQYAEGWNKIFSYYNLPLLVPSIKKDTKVVSPVEPQQNGDDFEFTPI